MSMKKTNLPCDVRAAFKRVFRRWIDAAKVPVKEIAAGIGVSISTVYHWRSGDRWPGGDNLLAISQYTGLPICQLVCDRVICDRRCVARDGV